MVEPGGGISLIAGAGGNSTGTAGTDGADITLQAGAGGTGTTNGDYGNIAINPSGGTVTIGGSATLSDPSNLTHVANSVYLNPSSTVSSSFTFGASPGAMTNATGIQGTQDFTAASGGPFGSFGDNFLGGPVTLSNIITNVSCREYSQLGRRK